MPRTRLEDDWDNEDPDFDAPGEGEPEDSEEEETIPCPYCRRPIHEDAQRCPHCENYISEEDAPVERKPVWMIVGALLVVLVVFLWIMG